MKNLMLIISASVALLLVAAACGGDSGEKVVTGRVVDAITRDIVELESLTVRDSDSQIWEFTTTGPIGMSMGHLRQHQALAAKIQVTYTKVGDLLIASNIQDAAVADGETP
jgi:hypothetical protein